MTIRELIVVLERFDTAAPNSLSVVVKNIDPINDQPGCRFHEIAGFTLNCDEEGTSAELVIRL